MVKNTGTYIVGCLSMQVLMKTQWNTSYAVWMKYNRPCFSHGELACRLLRTFSRCVPIALSDVLLLTGTMAGKLYLFFKRHRTVCKFIKMNLQTCKPSHSSNINICTVLLEIKLKLMTTKSYVVHCRYDQALSHIRGLKQIFRDSSSLKLKKVAAMDELKIAHCIFLRK